MKRYPTILWGGMLLTTYVAVVPVAVALLQRTLLAARNIERYTAEMLAAGVAIAEHTASVSALNDTLTLAPLLVHDAESLARSTGEIGGALDPSASENGHAADATGGVTP